ncbi:MAG TPA: FAD binding domain-containing protein [Gaiellales bacterium]|nr:FAD binding domain-containing protein [Gaiellales bacterium]
MIPTGFEYERPDSVAAAVSLLERAGDGARPLAGGHSLLPMMKLRLAAPDLLVDLSGIADLRGIRDAEDHVAVGAMTTHAEVAASDLLAAACPVVAEAAAGIGDMQVRNRGTIGGALAHADAHADMPAVLLALGGSVIAEGPSGSRQIAADDLFLDHMTTALSADEILTEVRVPKLRSAAYVKFTNRAQDWATVGAAAAVAGGRARIALTGVASHAIRAAAAEQAFDGSNLAQAAARAADGLAPPSDTTASGEFRAHLATVMVERALRAAIDR